MHQEIKKGDYLPSVSAPHTSDWRLPTLDELKSLVQEQPQGFVQIDTEVFQNCPNAGFWSSSPRESYPAVAWYVDFDDGGSYAYYQSNDFHVRLVRCGQFFDPLDPDIQSIGTYQVNLRTGTALDKQGLEWKIPAEGQTWDALQRTVIGEAFRRSWKEAFQCAKQANDPGLKNNDHKEIDEESQESLLTLVAELRELIFNDASDTMQGAMVGSPSEVLFFAKNWIKKASGIDPDNLSKDLFKPVSSGDLTKKSSISEGLVDLKSMADEMVRLRVELSHVTLELAKLRDVVALNFSSKTLKKEVSKSPSPSHF